MEVTEITHTEGSKELHKEDFPQSLPWSLPLKLRHPSQVLLWSKSHPVIGVTEMRIRASQPPAHLASSWAVLGLPPGLAEPWV